MLLHATISGLFTGFQAKRKYENGAYTDQQETNAAGVPAWWLLILPEGETRPQKVTVFSHAEPKFKLGEPMEIPDVTVSVAWARLDSPLAPPSQPKHADDSWGD